MAMMLRGKEVAAALVQTLTKNVQTLGRSGITPTLAILRVGERAGDMAYERGATSRCEALGVEVRKMTLPGDCSQERLMEAIRTINGDDSIHGCLLLRPLPEQLDEQTACEALRPEKDVDGITSGALAGVFADGGTGFPPCTAQACMEILDHYGYDLRGRRAVVVGRSLVIGRPVAMMLLRRDATVTICHSRTADLAEECRRAEFLIAAVGRAGIVDGRCIAPGQVVIDVGINDNGQGGLCGDVAFDEAEAVAGAITPVPGGVGAVTTAVLAKHVIAAAARTCGVKL